MTPDSFDGWFWKTLLEDGELERQMRSDPESVANLFVLLLSNMLNLVLEVGEPDMCSRVFRR